MRVRVGIMAQLHNAAMMKERATITSILDTNVYVDIFTSFDHMYAGRNQILISNTSSSKVGINAGSNLRIFLGMAYPSQNKTTHEFSVCDLSSLLIHVI